MPKNKKDPALLQKRKWTDPLMEKCLNILATTTQSVYEVAKNNNVPYATLKTRYEGRPIRPDLGPRTVFTKEQEQSMRTFLLECTILGIHKTRKDMELDLQHYIIVKQIPTPFRFSIPGNAWFERFLKLDGIIMVFPTEEEKEQMLSSMQPLGEWTATANNYVKDHNQGVLLDDTRRTFLIELKSFDLQTTPKKSIDTLLCYNAIGEHVKPLILHSGDIYTQTENSFIGHLLFYKTWNGHVTRNTVVILLIFLNKLVEDNKIQKPVVVHLDPKVAQMLSYYAWLLCQEYDIIPIAISRNIHGTMITHGLGLFQKICLSFNPLVLTRYVMLGMAMTANMFPAEFFEIWSHIKIDNQAKNTFKRMKMNRLQASTRNTNDVAEDIQHEVNRVDDTQETNEIEVQTDVLMVQNDELFEDVNVVENAEPEPENEQDEDVEVLSRRQRNRNCKTCKSTQTVESSFQLRTTYHVTMYNDKLPDIA